MKTKLFLIICVLFSLFSCQAFGAASAASDEVFEWSRKAPRGCVDLEQTHVCKSFETKEAIWEEGYMLQEGELDFLVRTMGLTPSPIRLNRSNIDCGEFDGIINGALIKRFASDGSCDFWISRRAIGASV